VFDLTTYLSPQSMWRSTLSFFDEPMFGFVVLMGAMLLGTFLLLGRRPRLSVDPSKEAPTAPARLRR
jgi:hypothetical protein